ncbi:MAG: DUF4212 domain-containing protein [Desulfuromonas sp.]|nr:MAG: DUF4212 domain-containing protein [Desulfuromonas sp.]
MTDTKASSPPPSSEGAPRINLFRPRSGFARKEVLLIWAMLAGWGGGIYGFQALLVLLQRQSDGAGPLTETGLFGFPLHYWYTGQFLIVWFIVLCILFNLLADRIMVAARRQKQRGEEQ